MNRIKELYESDKLSDEKKEALKLAFRQKFPQYAEDISGKTEDKIMQENTIKMSTPKAKVKTKAFAGVAAAVVVLVGGMAVAKHIYTVRSLQEPAGSQVDMGGNDISHSDMDAGNPMYENKDAFAAAKNFYCAATSAYVDLTVTGDTLVTNGDIIDSEKILSSRGADPEQFKHEEGTVSVLEFAAKTDEYARGMGYDAADWDIEIIMGDSEEMPVTCARVYTDREQGKYESYPHVDSFTGESDDGTIDLVEYTYTNKDAKMLYDEASKVFEELRAEGYDISCNSVSERDYVINPTSPLHIDDTETKPANTEDNIIDADEFDKALYDLGGMAYTIAWNHPCNFVIEFTSDDGVYATGIVSAKVVINNRVSFDEFETFTWKEGDVLEDENTEENARTDDLQYEDSYTAALWSMLEGRHFSAEYEDYTTDDAAPDGRYLSASGTVEANGDIIHDSITSASLADTWEEYQTSTDIYSSFNGSEWERSSQTDSVLPYHIFLLGTSFDAKDLIFTKSEDETDTVTEYFKESDEHEYVYTYDKSTGNIISYKHIYRYYVNGTPHTNTEERVFKKFSEDVGELTLPDIG